MSFLGTEEKVCTQTVLVCKKSQLTAYAYVLVACAYSAFYFSVYLEIYGCQMNVNDADIAWTFLSEAGYLRTDSAKEASNINTVYHIYTYSYMHIPLLVTPIMYS